LTGSGVLADNVLKLLISATLAALEDAEGEFSSVMVFLLHDHYVTCTAAFRQEPSIAHMGTAALQRSPGSVSRVNVIRIFGQHACLLALK
jgi:hypothetical protein